MGGFTDVKDQTMGMLARRRQELDAALDAISPRKRQPAADETPSKYKSRDGLEPWQKTADDISGSTPRKK